MYHRGLKIVISWPLQWWFSSGESILTNQCCFFFFTLESVFVKESQPVLAGGGDEKVSCRETT